MSLSFGTDGIRGLANEELTPELSLAIGRAAASVLGSDDAPFLIGRDTRESGPMIQSAISAGLASAGFDVVDLGVAPTPAIAYLSSRQGCPAVVVSASHNPYYDNGIKFFASGGMKLTSGQEMAFEQVLNAPPPIVIGKSVGDVITRPNGLAPYVDKICSIFGGELTGLHVIVDCSNGAASRVVADVLKGLAVRFDVINASPDGKNINDGCGSTHPEQLQREVVKRRADIGLALDGDADRVIAVDEQGDIVDGDFILAMLALDASQRGVLKDDTLVVTVMSNLGLRVAMQEHGIRVHETPVGDRNVLEALSANGWSLGGEQSGHVILHDFATTGDGLLTGMSIVQLLARDASPLSDIARRSMKKFPQCLRNVPVRDKSLLEASSEVREAIENARRSLVDGGRVFVRASGTESLVRVMVEHHSQQLAEQICDQICSVVENNLGRAGTDISPHAEH